jgi:NADH:ubiquinone oxidoreductase subunit E
MNKEQQKDEIISIVKKAIAANSYIAVSDDRVISDCNGVDHIAEEVADAVYNFYKPIDNEPVGALGECGLKGECEKKAVKEFAERVKARIYESDVQEPDIFIIKPIIDELLKEYEQ